MSNNYEMHPTVYEPQPPAHVRENRANVDPDAHIVHPAPPPHIANPRVNAPRARTRRARWRKEQGPQGCGGCVIL